MAIDYNLYKIFLSVASNLSFTKAADELFVSQSAISQSIKKLEQALGVILFQREGKKISLTKKGFELKNFLDKGENIFNSAHKFIKNDLEDLRIGIACPDIYFSSFVLPHVMNYQRNHPKTTYNILSKSDYKYRISTVESDINEFAIIEESQKLIGESIISQKIGELHYRLIYNPEKFKITNKMTITDIFDKFHFLMQSTTTRPHSYLESLLNENFPKQYSEFYHVDILIDAVEKGLGVGFAPIEFFKNRKVKSSDLLQKTVTLHLIYKKQNEQLAKELFELK